MMESPLKQVPMRSNHSGWLLINQCLLREAAWDVDSIHQEQMRNFDFFPFLFFFLPKKLFGLSSGISNNI